MSAYDDYPLPEGPTARATQRREMLAEIDLLRRDVATLLAHLATTGFEWPAGLSAESSPV